MNNYTSYEDIAGRMTVLTVCLAAVFALLITCTAITNSEIHDLQRRVGQLEQQIQRLEERP